jgi:hypothetical protein
MSSPFVSLVGLTLITLGSLAPVRPLTAAQPEVIRKSLSWTPSAKAHVLELSNINGDVRIVAEDRSDVAVIASRTVTRQGAAGDAGPVPDFRQDTDRVLVCGDGQRCGCNLPPTRDGGWWDEDRTRVRVDFDVHVPESVTLDVCVVNGRSLTVEGTDGPYTIRNVNGAIDLVGVRGAGRVSTVNGDVTASFERAPTAAATFKTVNGRVDLSMPAKLAADLRLTTLHGGVYTDFDTAPLPVTPTTERRDGRFIYRADRSIPVRVGGGGPEITVETVNGDIRVRKQ